MDDCDEYSERKQKSNKIITPLHCEKYVIYTNAMYYKPEKHQGKSHLYQN